MQQRHRADQVRQLPLGAAPARRTKHVAVQEELTKGYKDFLANSISRAKKTYGKNWIFWL
jgi:hypothetical protein